VLDGLLLDSHLALQPVIDEQELDSRRPAHWTYFPRMSMLFLLQKRLAWSVVWKGRGWADLCK